MDTQQITDRERRILRAILPPRQTRKSQEDRLKALAGALQTSALSIAGIGIITPLLTATVPVSLSHMIVAGCGSLFMEGISLLILAYIPYPPDEEKTEHG